MARLPGRTLPEQIAAFRAKAIARLHTTTRETMLGLGERVIARTPVKTGNLAGNWNYSVGSPDITVSDNTGRRGLNNADAMPAQAAGLKHYVSNGVPYGVFVEHGTSRMAPRAMVALTFVEATDILRSAVALAKSQHP